MKFSAWSSLVISVCSALVFAGAASAHLSIDPQRVQPGAEVDLVFSVPNEDDAVGVDHVTLGIPADFELDDAEAKPGWTQSRTGQAVTWSGGLIPKGQFARVRDPGHRAGEVRDGALQRARRRPHRQVDHLPGRARRRRDQPRRTRAPARSAKAALVIAIVAAALALVALFAWVYRWIRPTPALTGRRARC